MATKKPLISIVTPCYNEAENVENHLQLVNNAIAPYINQFDFEHIYTDNCSQDQTFQILKQMSNSNKNLKVIRFSRNIGANRAIFIGLKKAAGDAVMLIQADLQDPPELIPQFLDGWKEGYDVVYGKILEREEGWLLKKLRNIYYYLISKLSDIPIPQNAGEFRLTSRRALNSLLQFEEDDLYIRGAMGLVGFKQKAILYKRNKRAAGESSINFLGLIAYAINGLLSTTVVPLRLVSILGFSLAVLGAIMIVILISTRLLYPQAPPQGFTTLAVLIVFFAGLQTLALGVIGEYIRKIYIQSLHRPRGFIQDELNFD